MTKENGAPLLQFPTPISVLYVDDSPGRIDNFQAAIHNAFARYNVFPNITHAKSMAEARNVMQKYGFSVIIPALHGTSNGIDGMDYTPETNFINGVRNQYNDINPANNHAKIFLLSHEHAAKKVRAAYDAIVDEVQIWEEGLKSAIEKTMPHLVAAAQATRDTAHHQSLPGSRL